MISILVAVKLTAEEEVETRAEWARNDAAQVAEQLLAAEKATRKAVVNKEVQTKLQLTDEEIDYLRSNNEL